MVHIDLSDIQWEFRWHDEGRSLSSLHFSQLAAQHNLSNQTKHKSADQSTQPVVSMPNDAIPRIYRLFLNGTRSHLHSIIFAISFQIEFRWNRPNEIWWQGITGSVSEWTEICASIIRITRTKPNMCITRAVVSENESYGSIFSCKIQ